MKRITDNQLQQKRTSKGKVKIPIARIIDKTTRQVTFSKRRSGLIKKCSELCTLFPGTQFAAITFSVGGKPFSHGYPCFDTVINRFLNDNRQGNSSRNVVCSDKNWWEASVDDMRLEELEEFVVSLKGLQNGVVSKVAELSRVRESENGFTSADPQISNYCEQSAVTVESYNFPDDVDSVDYVCTDASLSSKFSDYSHKITESFDLGPVNGHVGTLFDVIKGINFGCNDATVCPNSDNCRELMEIINSETVDATQDAQGSDICPEIESIDFGCNDGTVCPNSDNCRELMEIINSETVDATPDAQGSDICPEIESIDFGCNDATVCPNSDNCQEFMEIINFESVDATPDAQGSDICPEIESIDFGSNDETFSPQFNSQERRKSFDLTEVLKSIDVECNDGSLCSNSCDVTESFNFGVDARAQVSDYSSWSESVSPEFVPTYKYLPADNSSLLSAIGCC